MQGHSLRAHLPRNLPCWPLCRVSGSVCYLSLMCPVLCRGVCGKLLPCGLKCPDTCHAGPFPPCQLQRDMLLLCLLCAGVCAARYCLAVTSAPTPVMQGLVRLVKWWWQHSVNAGSSSSGVRVTCLCGTVRRRARSCWPAGGTTATRCVRWNVCCGRWVGWAWELMSTAAAAALTVSLVCLSGTARRLVTSCWHAGGLIATRFVYVTVIGFL